MYSAKTHLAAIAAFHDEVQGTIAFAHRLTQCFLKSLSSVFSPRPRIVPQWSLPLVLASLRNPPFEPLAFCSLVLLSSKVAFLVAVTSARTWNKLVALRVALPFLKVLSGLYYTQV